MQCRLGAFGPWQAWTVSLTSVLVATDHEEWFIKSVGRLARGEPSSLDSYLVSVDEERYLDGTRARCRCHFIARDGNGRVRVDALAQKLASEVTDYCIPRSRIAEAHEHYNNTGSTEFFNQLQREAKSLFVDVDNSGEAGELLIFLLLERLLGIPQVLCKMSLKTNSSVHFHGVDGVHVKALEGGRLAVYWCESKVYADFAAATGACLKSIAPFLLDHGLGVAERDVTLLRTNLDSGDSELDDLLVKYFVEDAIQVTMREFRGASLIGFALDDYPDPGVDREAIPAELQADVDSWYESIARRVQSEGVEMIELEVFCLPIPSAQGFRDAFRSHLRIA